MMKVIFCNKRHKDVYTVNTHLFLPNVNCFGMMIKMNTVLKVNKYSAGEKRRHVTESKHGKVWVSDAADTEETFYINSVNQYIRR